MVLVAAAATGTINLFDVPARQSFLIEMVGRMAAMGDKAYADIIREKFGIKFALLPLSADLIANFLLLSPEIGGAAFALYLLSDVNFRIWALVVGAQAATLQLAATGWTSGCCAEWTFG